MLIEGKNQIKEAILSNSTINKLSVDKNIQNRKDEIISLARQKHIKIEFLPKTLLDKKSQTGHHQGYIAESVDFQYSTLEELLKIPQSKNQTPFFVLLDGIEDPHNLGAIIRSCECGGVHGIVIPKNRACQVNETVIRTSAGAISNIKIAQITNLKEAISLFQKNDIWVFCAEAGGKDVYKTNLNLPLALVIGSEGNGVKASIKEKSDEVISLPLMGSVNSLNASVATGVLIFEALRQRIK